MIKNRYESPLGASPSRNLDHSHQDELFDRSTSYRGSVGRAIGHGNSYNGKFSEKIIYQLRIYNFLKHRN